MHGWTYRFYLTGRYRYLYGMRAGLFVEIDHGDVDDRLLLLLLLMLIVMQDKRRRGGGDGGGCGDDRLRGPQRLLRVDGRLRHDDSSFRFQRRRITRIQRHPLLV